MIDFKLPDIGEGIKNVIVTDILIKIGQSVKKDDIVIIVESEKASMEIPINTDCIIEKIFIKNGDSISPGDSILSTSKTSIKINQPKTTDKHIKKINEDTNEKKTSTNIIDDVGEKVIYASPSVRKLARELDCDLNMIQGSGENGRILIEDINNQLNINESDVTKDNDNLFDECSKWGVTEKIELNNIKIITGKRLHHSWSSIPHVTQFDECDITDLDKIRKLLKKKNTDNNIKISFVPFFIKAIVKTIKDLPIFNSSLSQDGNFIYRKKYFNIGIAVNTDSGLLVPVIKNADTKSIKKISYELTDIIKKTKNKKLSPDHLSGGCMTITSLGGVGGTYFTPIINPPEVAILGISKIKIKPRLINNKFKARKILPISLSYDHRVIDGVQAAEFTSRFSNYISNPNSL